MTDDEILTALRAKRGRAAPVELAELLDTLTGGRLSQTMLVSYFGRAFPDIPLRVLLDAGGWTRLGDGRGDYSDDGFNDLLRPWLLGTDASQKGD